MTHTSQGPALLLWHKAVALEFLPMGAQLSLKPALPLAGILATASDRYRKTGPLQTPASPGAVLQRARRIHVSWCPAQQMDSRANKCDVIIGNDMTSQSRKDLRQCVLSHWRFIQLSLRIVTHKSLDVVTQFLDTVCLHQPEYLPPCVCGLFPSKWKNSTSASSFRKRHGIVLLDLLFRWDHDSVFLWNKWLIPL